MALCRPVRDFLLVAFVFSFAGCGKTDPTQFNVAGTVTFQGENVPLGIIYFEPDASKQNRGPQGYAYIEDGRYDTSDSRGRGVVGGPYRMTISAYDAQNANEMQPYGQPLVTDHMVAQDLPNEDTEIDFALP